MQQSFMTTFVPVNMAIRNNVKGTIQCLHFVLALVKKLVAET